MGNNQVKEKDPHESTPILMPEINGKGNREMENEFQLHKAAYIGDVDKVKEILKHQDDQGGKSIVRRLDLAQMTPLHNAAYGGSSRSTEVVRLLLDYEDPTIYPEAVAMELLVNIQDTKNKTALHYAAASKQPSLIALLLENDADPNTQDENGRAPLHICCEGNSEAAVECANLLLKSTSIRHTETCGPNSDNRNVLHIAANAKAHIMVQFLLDKGFDHSKPDGRGFTPLHLAANAGDTPEAVRCVQDLLKASSVDEVNAKSKERGQTALTIAAFKSHQHVLAALLDDITTNIWATDNEKRTALHWATEAWFRTHSFACVKLLVECNKIADWHDKARFLYGQEDAKDETAMDIAIKHRSIRIAEYLIQAHPSPEAWLKDGMLERIYTILPEAMIPLMNNKGLTYNPARFHERNEAIDAEFGSITGYSDPIEDEIKQETKYLHNLLYSPKEIQRSIFLHPLVQIFIDLKWKKIRPITWLAIAFQFIWLSLYTVLVFELYTPNCPNDDDPKNSTITVDDPARKKSLKFLLSLGFYHKESSNLTDCTFMAGWALGIALVMYLMSIVIVIKEIFQMKNNSNYFWDSSNLAQWTVLIIFVINSYPAFQTEPQISKWQSYLAALGIFGAWILSLREIGKFPNCGIYAAILKKVFWHCLKMIIFYFPLLMAFAMCLRILLPGKGQYTYMLFSIVKVVIMMTGELDFDDAFYEGDMPNLALYAIFGQIVFLLLVFVTTIVLLNLLTGLAVNDVQSLIEEAEINRLSNELEQIYLLESLILFLRRTFGEDKCTSLLHKLNVTSTEYVDYSCFTSKISGVETKSYSPDLKRRIKECMVPDVSED